MRGYEGGYIPNPSMILTSGEPVISRKMLANNTEDKIIVLRNPRQLTNAGLKKIAKVIKCAK